MNKFDPQTASARDIRERIKTVLAEVSGLEPHDIDVNMAIADDIAPNSIDRITLFMALEDEFGQSIPEQEVRHINTVEELIEFVEVRVRALRGD